MRLEPVPVLRILRELWSMPRDMVRFHAYLEKVKAGPGGDASADASSSSQAADGNVFVPLIAANPMAKPHMIAFVDQLLAFDADKVLAESCAEAQKRLARVEMERRVSLTPIDDIGVVSLAHDQSKTPRDPGVFDGGAWSERTMVDFDNRFGTKKAKKDYGFSVGVVYVSEPVSAALVRERVLASIYRAAWSKKHGAPETVRDMLAQEGNALRFAGAAGPVAADVERVRGVLADHLDSNVHATKFAAMYGDAAAERCGHAKLGLPDDAGFALALHDAMRARTRPEELV